ncbi:MAG TPA: YceI family protein [Candidatus Angelobacter sp.]|nr:YceI family protein [Candidatus Angelobacter sp.]
MRTCFRCLVLAVTLLLACRCFPKQLPTAKPSEIDVEHSSLTVHVQRGGMFGFTGDNHEIHAPISKGKVDEVAKSVDFQVETAKMQVLDPKMDPAKRAQVQEKMLGPDVLDSAHYPLIEFSSTSVQSDKSGHWFVTGNLKLHGQSRPVTVQVSQPAQEARAAGAGPKVRHYSGTASLKQSDFGIKPISIAGGTVKVKDEIKIDFEIVTR